MSLSEARKKANNKWDKENMCVIGCKVKKEFAEKVKEYAKSNGESVNAYIKRLIEKDIGLKEGKF